MLGKSTIAVATAAILGLVSVAQAATKDKRGASTSRIVHPVNYQRYGNPRFSLEPQAPHLFVRDDEEGYPHPK